MRIFKNGPGAHRCAWPKIIVFAVVLSTSAMAWAGTDPVAAKPKPVVFVSAVQSAELFDVLTYPARVTPKINTTILAETDGVVSRIAAPLGQRVGRLQKLMTVTHTDPAYQYAPVSVVSPVGGVVSSVEVTVGTQVARGQRLATVTDPKQVLLNVEVPALDLPGITTGLAGEFRVSGREDSVAVKVRGVSPFVDPATGTATCELELADPKSATYLAPGVLGQVTFKANAHRGISVPEQAIIYKGNSPFVRLVEAGKARQVAVKLGRRQRGSVEVLSGLAAGASLVERSSRYIADGEEVSVEGGK